jgi:hypothetical protein
MMHLWATSPIGSNADASGDGGVRIDDRWAATAAGQAVASKAPQRQGLTDA